MPNDYWDMDDKNAPNLLNLASVSTSMLVPFPVGKLPDASVLWLNERWFHDLGIAIHDKPTRTSISASLLERFAVTSLEAHCVAGSFGRQTLGADRYGGSGGAIHGGSGRCGSDGMLIAKGTGPTPLVSEAHDWSHSHGCLYLYDAIREAVASEILNAELPHGAVPIVAIIDAGFSLARTDADEPERCAILIRPAFLRLAHFERSLYFGTAGNADSDQFQDSLRVRDAIHFADEHAQRDAGNSNGLGVDLSGLYLRLAEQIAASRAHRLWTGRPTSDNITLNAQFLDFGGFRAVPSWKHGTDGHRHFFGDEMRDVRHSLPSLAYFFKKYSRFDKAIANIDRLLIQIKHHMEAAFLHHCAEACALPESSQEVLQFNTLIARYYREQQRRDYAFDQPAKHNERHDWLSDHLRGKATQGSQLGEEIAAFLRTLPNADLHLCAANRWVRPRPRLSYRVSKRRAIKLVRSILADRSSGPERVSAFIATEVAVSRRVWKGLPSHWLVLGYASDHVSTALYFFDTHRMAYTVQLDGPRVCGGTLLFGAEVAEETLGISNSGYRTVVLVDCEPTSYLVGLGLNGRATIPAALLTFPDAAVAAQTLRSTTANAT
ncbi:protein adenylyltransferase SelO family protein [Xanthomonas vesicatoria]|uniref:protein adenylyltransferase SelO family protein n=1 Tax=Xanthomonas vesicatoria TaxID=56460 RepID=UPI001E3CC676|nr:protein adenylyltransferase SelO family protein [Xanthomonas vesicatoria]MCC8626468.1 protein adenylyltransferase SelO family protein [Xanthomonas vesicatoria]MDG4481823.1 YdiU family protein [Xanthomonas vesicatoria]